MKFDDLERAVDLRQQSAHAASPSHSDGSNKRGADDDPVFRQIQAESSYLLLNHTRTSSDHQNHRTGRWSAEEVAFVDALGAAFDHGALPIPHGIKLNEFLGDMILCKSSRLTKKMKNAKLSTRSYTLGPFDSRNSERCMMLTTLQEQFLQSVPLEAMKLELRFNLTKLWRTHFSNLCLQVGYENLDARQWLGSLENMEARAADAEDFVRKARRRRMGLALRNDVCSTASVGVFIGGRPATETTSMQGKQSVETKPMVSSNSLQNLVSDASQQADQDDMDMLADVLGVACRPRSGSMDFDISGDIDDCFGDQLFPQLDDAPQSLGDCGPFLDNIVQYMEDEKVPFQHVDVWAPSFATENGDGPSQSGDILRLFHAGHATRADIDSTLAFQLHEYGTYSTHFSFAPGAGLPGRVYSSGEASWETQVNDADPTHFERAGGAKIYGIKTAVGIPLESSKIGRVVVAMYSCNEMKPDPKWIAKFQADLRKWTPEPKWKLVIELGAGLTPSANNAPDSDFDVKSSAIPQPVHSYKSPALPPATLPPSSIQLASLEAPGLPLNWQTMKTPPLHSQPMPSTMQWQLQHSSPNSASMEDAEDDEEQTIAQLLGQHMPMTDQVSTGSASLLSHFMSLRLLLLRSAKRRSEEEQDMLNILVKSYRGYSKANRRSGEELALLLAKDWMYLSSSLPPITPSPITPGMVTQNRLEQHQCHVLAAPILSSTAGAGAPLKPHAAPLLALHTAFASLNSFDAAASMDHYHHSTIQRRITEDNTLPANIVEEP